ncbi:pyridoxal phosphate-dependent decarboxylase family protein [Salinispora cortesiana]|uniref:pyridoxal phosphate-dependent decarboxylase family protein n=1 Tax=Salinispora cortesiana TaxID=1305843 RepID=UPI00035E2CC6|nr:pyridoxal-dependent decarboxylase [Salinispora cortesiana]
MSTGRIAAAAQNLDRRRVTAWRRVLDGVNSLSSRYRARYAVVLAQLERSADPAAVLAARSAIVVDHDAGRAAAILAGTGTRQSPTERLATPQRLAPEPRGHRTVVGSEPLLTVVRDLLRHHADVTAFVTAHPCLEQTAVPLHPSRQAHLICADGRELVALRWAAESVAERSAHQQRMSELLTAVSDVAPLPVVAHDEYVRVQQGEDDPWVFAPNLGQTLEDRFREDAFALGERGALIDSMIALRCTMLAAGVVWQGFAPRNMFLRDSQLVLIDFEEVVVAGTDPVRAAECLRWHQIFFADCLTAEEASRLFASAADEPDVDDDQVRAADGFERALLGVATVTWRQRRELLRASAVLEGRHTRPGGGILYGHELGHFWGDFVPVREEARLFGLLRAVAGPEQLAAVLEVLEAAMEADICRNLRLRAHGTPEMTSPRTTAAIDVLEAIGSARLATFRLAYDRWYDELTTDPCLLVDEILHVAGSTLTGLNQTQLDTYLVGNEEARKTHEESLARATRIGLDLLHRTDEPFLHYREPDELRTVLSRPLPRDGVDLDTVLTEVDEVVARYAIAQSHPAYLAFPDTGNAVAAVAGGVLGRILHQNLIAVDRSAPSATFVEIQVIEWLRELVGYDSAPVADLRGVRDVAGLWATGGHLSNHIAMLVALGRRFPQVRQRGLAGLDTQPAVVMAGPIAHYSHSDAAFHLGLGWDAVISVGAEAGYTTDPAAVAAALADPPPGKTPFMVVGVAGNCRTTGLDDLAALADICRRHHIWFHVDACHGGSMIFSERLRRRHLSGINLADSVSLDPHKGLFTPYPSSYVVFRDRGVLTHFSRHEAAVMADGCWDLGLITPFLGSRGFESLATWMLLRHVGVRHLGDLVESRQTHVRYLERRIDDSDLFVRLNDVDFYRLAFVLCPPEVRRLLAGFDPLRRRRSAQTISRYTSRLNTILYRTGQVCFDEHTLSDLGDRVGAGAGTSYTIMATCPGNPLLTRADLDRAMDRLLRAATPLVPDLLAELSMTSGGSSTPPPVAGPAGWSDMP